MLRKTILRIRQYLLIMDLRLVPNKLEQLIIHKDIAKKLLNFTSENIPNMVIYGNKNIGKHTIARLLINHFNDCNINNQLNVNTSTIKINNNTVNIEYLSSPYHIEVNLYEYGLYDKHIINDFIGEYVKYKNIAGRFKFVILNHIDKITIHAQNLLRGIIENNGTNVRFICLVDSLTLIHPSLLSRVLAIRIPEIKLQDKKEYIQYVCDNFVNLTESKKKKLYEINSIFELNYRISSFISSKKKIKLNTYDDSIKSIIKYIDESNISSIINIRTICYNLLLNNISIKYIYKFIINHYLSCKSLSSEKKYILSQIASSIEAKMCNIEHDIICLEFLILKVKKLLIKQ